MIWADIISTIAIGLGHMLLFYYLFGYNKSQPAYIVFLAACVSLLLILLLQLFPYPELNVVVLTVVLWSIGHLHRRYAWHQTLLLALFSIVLYTFMKNGVYMLLYELFMQTDFPYFYWVPIALMHGTLLLLLVVIVLAQSFLRAAGRYMVTSKFYPISYIIVLGAIVSLLIVNFPTITLLATWNTLYGSSLYKGACIVMLILFSSITVMTYISKERFIERQQKREQQQFQAYVEKLEFLHDELATFRHDYVNILVSLEQSIVARDWAQVEQVYTQTIAPTKEIVDAKQLAITKLTNMKCIEVKSLVSMKVIEAQKKGIDLQVDMPMPINAIPLAMPDYLRIVSVLLDNAIEATPKDQSIQFSCFEHADQFYTIVRNDCHVTIHELESLFQKQHSTKGTARGLGLFSLQRLLTKYRSATLTTAMEHGQFEQRFVFKQPLENKKRPFEKKEIQ